MFGLDRAAQQQRVFGERETHVWCGTMAFFGQRSTFLREVGGFKVQKRLKSYESAVVGSRTLRHARALGDSAHTTTQAPTFFIPPSSLQPVYCNMSGSTSSSPTVQDVLKLWTSIPTRALIKRYQRTQSVDKARASAAHRLQAVYRAQDPLSR